MRFPQPQVAIVGSRVPTAAGRRFATQIATELSAAGLIITSGLARGIDTAAHDAALAAGGPTIAVLGTGLDLCYPADNQAAVTAHPRAAAHWCRSSRPALPPRAGTTSRAATGSSRAWPAATVVVEAATDSGSLITAAARRWNRAARSSPCPARH